jgi:competence protein ComEA
MWKSVLTLTALCTALAATAAVDLNQAGVADLDGIKGIGPAVSARILDERQKGSFKDWGDFIARVKGIGAANAARFSSEGLVIDGIPYDRGAQAGPAPASSQPKQ